MSAGGAWARARHRLPPLTSLLELLALAGFAVGQPLLDVFGRSPEQFIVRDASPLAIVAFGLVVAIGPAAALAVLEVLVGSLAGARARRGLHLVLIGGLAALVAIRVGKDAVSWRGPGLLVAAVAIGAGFAAVFARARLMRSWVRFASVAPIAFLVLFLVASPVAELVRPSSRDATQAVEVADPAPVVMLVLDELPLASLIESDGRIDEERYPGFAELAATSSWYRNTTAVSSSTWHAVPALLTGRYPSDTAPVVGDHPDNLFTLLGGSYDMRVDESITGLCPRELCRPERGNARRAAQALGKDALSAWREQVSIDDEEADPVAGLVEQPAAEPEGEGFDAFGLNQPTRYRDFLEGLGDTDGATLHYLHILLPHVPWRYLPSGRQYPSSGVEPGKVDEDFWTDDPWPAERGRQRHLLQVQYVDSLIQDLLARMRETGLLDEALLVVTADHGVAFQPGEPIRGLEVEQFAEAVHPELMWVPLFIKAPGQRRGQLSDANVETVDIVPTVADTLGIEIPWRVAGISTLDAGRPRDRPKTFFQSRVHPFGVFPGERAEVDGATSWPLVLQRAIPEELRGDDPLAPYRVGPVPELVGSDVASLDVGAPSSVRVQLEDTDQLDEVDLGSGTVPSLVTGTLGGASDELVLLSVGGRVSAIVPPFSVEGEPVRFAALLPEPFLRDGDLDLDVYVMDEGSGVVRPVTTEP